PPRLRRGAAHPQRLALSLQPVAQDASAAHAAWSEAHAARGPQSPSFAGALGGHDVEVAITRCRPHRPVSVAVTIGHFGPEPARPIFSRRLRRIAHGPPVKLVTKSRSEDHATGQSGNGAARPESRPLRMAASRGLRAKALSRLVERATQRHGAVGGGYRYRPGSRVAPGRSRCRRTARGALRRARLPAGVAHHW